MEYFKKGVYYTSTPNRYNGVHSETKVMNTGETKVMYTGKSTGSGLWRGSEGNSWCISDRELWVEHLDQTPLDMHTKTGEDLGGEETHYLFLRQPIDNGTIRQFETGASRDTAENKLDFEGFLCPNVLTKYSEYMHKHREMSDGNLRESDNWQKGIPMDAYMKSMFRHFMDVWKNHRGISTPEDKVTNLCALLFNVNGMLHEELKQQSVDE